MDLEWKAEHIAVGGLSVAAGLLIFAAVRQAGGTKVPVTNVTENLRYSPFQPALSRPADALPGEVVYTRHRYPEVVGGELTTAIHYGHSRLSVPHERDMNWITCPPSEVTI
jgi:hypothetical protein